MSHFQKGPVAPDLSTFGWVVDQTFFDLPLWKPVRISVRYAVASTWGFAPLFLELESPPYTVLLRIERATIICSQLGPSPSFFLPLKLESDKSLVGVHTGYWYTRLTSMWPHCGKLVSIVAARKGLWLYVIAGFRWCVHMDARGCQMGYQYPARHPHSVLIKYKSQQND